MMGKENLIVGMPWLSTFRQSHSLPSPFLGAPVATTFPNVLLPQAFSCSYDH